MAQRSPLNVKPYQLPTATAAAQPATLDPLTEWWVHDLAAVSTPRAGFMPRYNSQLPLFWTMESANYYQYPGRVGFGTAFGTVPLWFAAKNYGDQDTPIRKPRSWWNYFGGSDLTDPTFDVNKLMVKGRLLYGLDRAYPSTAMTGGNIRLSPVYLGICGWFPSKAVVTYTDTPPGGLKWEDPRSAAPWDLWSPPLSVDNPYPDAPPPIFDTFTTSTFTPLDNSKWTGGEILAYLSFGYAWTVRDPTPPYRAVGTAVLTNLLAADIASFLAAVSNFDRARFRFYWGYPYDTNGTVKTTIKAALDAAGVDSTFTQNQGSGFPAYTAYDTDLIGDLEAFYSLTLP